MCFPLAISFVWVAALVTGGVMSGIHSTNTTDIADEIIEDFESTHTGSVKATPPIPRKEKNGVLFDVFDDGEKDKFFEKLSKVHVDEMWDLVKTEIPVLGQLFGSSIHLTTDELTNTTGNEYKAVLELAALIKAHLDYSKIHMKEIKIITKMNARLFYKGVLHPLELLLLDYELYALTVEANPQHAENGILLDQCRRRPPHTIMTSLLMFVKACNPNKPIRRNLFVPKPNQTIDPNSSKTRRQLLPDCFLDYVYTYSDQPWQSMINQTNFVQDTALALIMMSAVCSTLLNDSKMFSSTLLKAASTQQRMDDYVKSRTEAAWPDEMRTKAVQHLKKYDESMNGAEFLHNLSAEIHQIMAGMSSKKYLYRVVLLNDKHIRHIQKLPQSTHMFEIPSQSRRAGLVLRIPLEKASEEHGNTKLRVIMSEFICDWEDIAVVGPDHFAAPSPAPNATFVQYVQCPFQTRQLDHDTYHVKFAKSSNCQSRSDPYTIIVIDLCEMEISLL